MEFEFPDEKTMESARIAIAQEDVGRAESEIRKNGKTLRIDIKSDDVVALRATVNAYMRALQVIEEVRK